MFHKIVDWDAATGGSSTTKATWKQPDWVRVLTFPHVLNPGRDTFADERSGAV
jgi:hypothetical protein